MEISQERPTLVVADGSSMSAFVARPMSSPPSAGILVFQEAFGVNSHIRSVAERFASYGYLAIAPELYHRTATGFEGSYTDPAPSMTHMRALTNEGMEHDIRSAFDWLAANGQLESFPIGSIGYCLGGRVSFLAAATVPLTCAVSYYGAGIAPNPNSKGLLDRVKNIDSPLLFFWGGQDKHIGPDQRLAIADTLREAGKISTTVEFSFADHGFNCDERASYNPIASAQSWALTLSFFEMNLRDRTGQRQP